MNEILINDLLVKRENDIKFIMKINNLLKQKKDCEDVRDIIKLYLNGIYGVTKDSLDETFGPIPNEAREAAIRHFNRILNKED